MTPLILSAASLCFCVFGFLFFRRYIDRKTAARELLADYRAETYRLIAEIDAAADRDSLLVEERIKTLKKLLEDTDRRISVYMREIQRSKAGEAMSASLGRGIRAALDSRPGTEAAAPQAEAAPPAPVPPQEEATREAAPQETVHQEAVQEIDAAEEEQPAAGKRRPKKAKLKAQIAELSAQGIPPAKIASRLGLSLAEVDLALNLLQARE
jgi:hypothetical protein